MAAGSENPVEMAWEPISPELALVDPELAARARASLAGPRPPARRPRPDPAAAPAAAPVREHHRPYPFWARVTAAVWLLAVGIMIGGAAIPHAQDKPRVLPRSDDVTVCTRPNSQPPQRPESSTIPPRVSG
jgi:hypothetical protein